MQEGGGVYEPHVCEVWWAGMQWEARRIKKSDHHSKQEKGGEREDKKRSSRRQKVKKTFFFPHLVALCLDPPAFPKGPWGCPLDHRRVQIQAFQRESDQLPIHIGSWSKIKLEQVTKKRVLQRVLRYYGGSTVPGCASGMKETAVSRWYTAKI